MLYYDVFRHDNQRKDAFRSDRFRAWGREMDGKPSSSPKISSVTDPAAIASARKQSARSIGYNKSGAAMTIASKKRLLVICAYLGSALCGLGGFATPVGAQNAVSPPASRSDSVAVSEMPGAAALTDGELTERVKAALHAAPYFYDAHVTVSVEQGDVVLRGFVFSDWDLRDAMRIASKAAGDRRVVDNLSIKQGGRR
jgi:hypothetical protein